MLVIMFIFAILLFQSFAIECHKIQLEHIKIAEDCENPLALEKIDTTNKINKNCFVSYKLGEETKTVYFRSPLPSPMDYLDYTSRCSGIDIKKDAGMDRLIFNTNCQLILNFINEANSCICSVRQCRETPTLKPSQQSPIKESKTAIQ